MAHRTKIYSLPLFTAVNKKKKEKKKKKLGDTNTHSTMGRYSVKRYKTKRMVRQLDLIYDDLQSKESITKLKDQPLDETKPGMGQFYCIHCAKYFENQHAITGHYKSKVHKRRLKELKVKPYTPLESEAASGLNINNFLEDCEKAKKRAADELEHKDEIKVLLETNNPKGIMLTGQDQQQPEEAVLEDKEVVMAE